MAMLSRVVPWLSSSPLVSDSPPASTPIANRDRATFWRRLPNARRARRVAGPQPMQGSWLAGSVIRQDGHNGRPWVSRVAASRTVPHGEQG